MKRNKKAAADPFEAVDVTQAFAGPIYQRSDGRRNVEELVIKQPISPTMVRVVSSQSQFRAEIATLGKVVVVSFCDGANPGHKSRLDKTSMEFSSVKFIAVHQNTAVGQEICENEKVTQIPTVVLFGKDRSDRMSLDSMTANSARKFLSFRIIFPVQRMKKISMLNQFSKQSNQSRL